jgi:hypothetical protein
MTADPLDMARNCAAAVERAADAQAADPVMAHAAGAGHWGWDAAQVGACMALISMAGDLRRLADVAEQTPWLGPPPAGKTV